MRIEFGRVLIGSLIFVIIFSFGFLGISETGSIYDQNLTADMMAQESVNNMYSKINESTSTARQKVKETQETSLLGTIWAGSSVMVNTLLNTFSILRKVPRTVGSALGIPSKLIGMFTLMTLIIVVIMTYIFVKNIL